MGGSSPLARGLRVVCNGGMCRLRIIPARAGFTVLLLAHDRVVPDHPRSRGVYIADLPLEDRLLGSSPLARGLRQRGALREGRGGIIPARAGFTETRPSVTGSG